MWYDVIEIFGVNEGIIHIDTGKIIFFTSIVHQDTPYKVTYVEQINGNVNMEFLDNNNYLIEISYRSLKNYISSSYYIQTEIYAGVKSQNYEYTIKCINGRLKIM